MSVDRLTVAPLPGLASIAYGAGDGGWALGLAYAILMVTGLIPGIGAFLGIAGLVVWVIYWIKISDFSKRLGAPAAP